MTKKMVGVNLNKEDATGSSNSIGSFCSDDSLSESNAISADDVLCGRGGLTNSHIGNKRFRCIVAEYQHQYLNAKKKEKKQISNQIVERIHTNGGRFLKRSAISGIWAEVTPTKATEKTSQALREGLDVKHKTIRPEKHYLRDSGAMQETNPRKRARLVEGMVMESPKLSGMSGGDVPDLDDESPHMQTDYTFTAQSRPSAISETDCDRVEQI